MLSNPDALLTTLAQSSAAIVAIVGGFLVSRLVALSSEREGLRRQLHSTRDHLTHVTKDYNEAHSYRFSNSKSNFLDWTIEDVAKWNDESDLEYVLMDNIPRGSSEEEMRPILEEQIAAAQRAQAAVRNLLRDDDDSRLTLDDLVERGLNVPPDHDDLYNYVVDHIAEHELPEPQLSAMASLSRMGMMRPSAFIPAGDHGTSTRRLDESIRDEQDLLARKQILEADEKRLIEEIARIGRPAGVTSAIVILSIYALTGIAAPVFVLAAGVGALHTWAVWGLVALFLTGLFAVLGYMLWYARTLDDPIHAPSEDATKEP